MASLLTHTIKKEDDILPRPSIPKRKAAIINIPPRARFAKARPNIGGGVIKALKDTQPSVTENKNTVIKEDKSEEAKEKPKLSTTDSISLNADVQDSESQSLIPTNKPLKKEPETLQRPSVLSKRTLPLPAVTRARYQKARPNIAALANKASVFVLKSSNVQKENDVISVSEKESTTECSELKSTETQGGLRKESTSLEKKTKNKEPIKGFSFSMGEVEIYPNDDPEKHSVLLPKDVQQDFVSEDNLSYEHQESSVTEASSTPNETVTDIPTGEDYILNSADEQEIFETSAKESQKQDRKKSNYLKVLSKITTKTTTDMTKESAPPTPSVNKPMEYPTLKSILNSPRKRTATKKTYERKRRLANLSETPSRSEMTMTDLIYYNPTGEPMKVSKPQTCAVENLPADENTKPVEEEPEEDENSNAPVPKVIINENGEIIIDESSLVVRRKETIDTSIEAIIENDNTTYSSFRKKSSKQWTNKETSKFYKALSLVGTDFALMESIFRVNGKVTRSRRELKLKFKREEKQRIELVHKAMYETQTYDISILDDDPDYSSTTSEEVDDAPKAPVVKKRGRKPKAASIEKTPSAPKKKKKKSNNAENESTADENSEPASGILEDASNEYSQSRSGEENSDVSETDQISQPKKISRPQRVRKTKALSDFITDIEESENSDGYISDTNSVTVIKKKTPVSSISIENTDNDVELLPIKIPAKVRKRKKIDVLFESSVTPDTNSPSLPDCSASDVSRLGRVRRAKVLTDFITDELQLEETDGSDGESVIGVGKRRKVQALSEDSNDECLEESGDNCILVEHISCLPETSTLEVIEKVKEEPSESPELVAQQTAEENQDAVFLAAINSPSLQDSIDLRNSQIPVKNNKTISSNENLPISSNLPTFPPTVMHIRETSAHVEPSERNCNDTNISQVHCTDIVQPNNDNVVNLLTDAVVSEVVITGSTKARRVRRKAAAPNLAQAKNRLRTEEEKPQIQPSFSNFTPSEEHSGPTKEIKTYSRRIKKEVLDSPSRVDQTLSVDSGISSQTSQAILDPVTYFPNGQAITLDSDTTDPPPVVIFTKSPNNENILHLYMVQSPNPNFESF